MRRISAFLIGLLLAVPATDALAQRRVTTNTSNTYITNNYSNGYGYNNGYYNNCGNCWLGPAAFYAGTALVTGLLMQPRTVVVAPPTAPAYIVQRTPVPGRASPMRPISETYIDPKLNRICRDFETEVLNREGFHDRVVKKFCEVDTGKRYVEVRMDGPGVSGPVPLH